MLKEKIILASKSPRRAEILRSVGWDFESRAANIDETRRESEEPVAYVERLAREKAATVAQHANQSLILAADTVVVVDHDVLGQPHEDEVARRMLRMLSGRWHEVLTGVAIMRGEGKPIVVNETTRVRFSELSEAEIDWYVATGEPHDKAGAYAIQGLGGVFIKEIEGDYFNIVGLPVRLVYEQLRAMGVGG